jgi:hypothetical protein
LLINFNEQVLKDGIKRVVNPDALDEHFRRSRPSRPDEQQP